MKRQLQILTIVILTWNFSFSQPRRKETNLLKEYSSFVTKRYHECGGGKWSMKNLIKNGLVYQEENYLNKKLMSIQKFVYDSNENLLYEIWTYSINSGTMNDTVFRYSYKYDENNRIIEREYNNREIEKYSQYDRNSKARLVERYNKDGKVLYFSPIKENREYDSSGNLVKEVRTKISFPDKPSDTIKKFEVETNRYKYDKFGNVIQIERSNDFGETYPIYMVGGFSLYEVEYRKYKYNKRGLWTKQYWIADRKKLLFNKRTFRL